MEKGQCTGAEKHTDGCCTDGRTTEQLAADLMQVPTVTSLFQFIMFAVEPSCKHKQKRIRFLSESGDVKALQLMSERSLFLENEETIRQTGCFDCMQVWPLCTADKTAPACHLSIPTVSV